LSISTDDAAVAALAEEIQSMVKDRKGSVRAPKRVAIIGALPLTALGMPDKKALRAHYWEGRDRAV
jgi:fatty-acyl-CoA synthase